MNSQQRHDPPPFDLRDTRLTEAFNPRTAAIGDADSLEIVRLLNAEDRGVAEAVAAEAEAVAGVIDDVASRLCRGGRLFYVGAGTSGRLGVLDASECPPTFGTEPESVQGIIAGGAGALRRSREGVEDDGDAGRSAISDAGVSELDFVLGIATSGTTPYVHAALEAAGAAGAGTGLLSCTPPPAGVGRRVDHLMTPLTGPEAIAGSTRLKAGTATKLVLNTITTGVMIRLGKVYGNLMVDLKAVSHKLVDRSLRILVAVTGLETEEARRLLISAGGSVKTAIAMHATRVGRFTAERRLDACDGFLGRMISHFPVGSPVEDFAEFPTSDCQGWKRLLERLAAAPQRVGDAAGRAAADEATIGRTESDVTWQIDHLARYEGEAIRPERQSWRPFGTSALAPWPPSTPRVRASSSDVPASETSHSRATSSCAGSHSTTTLISHASGRDCTARSWRMRHDDSRGPCVRGPHVGHVPGRHRRGRGGAGWLGEAPGSGATRGLRVVPV